MPLHIAVHGENLPQKPYGQREGFTSTWELECVHSVDGARRGFVACAANVAIKVSLGGNCDQEMGHIVVVPGRLWSK